MQKPIKGSCTTVLVGKKASIDGSTMISRNDDGHEALDPQRFVVVNPEDQPRNYQAVISGVQIQLPDNPMRYTSIPNSLLTNGIWPAAGINSENIAMSATETITTNPRIQGLDPFVPGGIGEEDIVTLVLPYIHSAQEGVERLGALLEEFGTYEPNGIAFSDKDSVWWLETIGGHHWAAVRIPDDAYVVAPNRMNIDHFDFDSADTLCSADLKALIDDNHLNPDFEGYNLRHIFGSASIKDTVYNNPRTWYGQQYFNPEIKQDPMDQDLPFICHANCKISIEDVKFVLSAHFENTEYDPYGSGPEDVRTRFRPIGINRNHNVHILQVRNNVPAEIAGIQWLAYGANTFNTVVPFYTNINDTPESYKNATGTFDLNNMYWLSCTTALLGDTDYDFYVDMRNTFELEAMSAYHVIQNETDKAFADQKDAAAFLEAANNKLASESLKRQTALLGQMVISGSEHMKLRYNLND
ncbi:C69 family dipeptidase [Latilactobacillus curvatus]|uniref:C69 family dipeptidase n=1 Tax=Latilactobacillus curvatus TaxID=28038 RepID=UPI0020749B90|nr:C69 family dipeptidase [Latilactobacillus curvatus]MCM6844764.1 C69 family dipeptidase [Latilactobacillus curvatus]MCM6860342.1 C69 family dipeptidase [Latilactobacillus curvatus]MCM6867639.1 C69 family dipeptidase [Latilactobacillus curvatus]MDG2983134.1 C69 family dipeptidase [Latilactobacillus curvatus]